MTFNLDTSGAVMMSVFEPGTVPSPPWLVWSDLSPFEQGYVEALFAAQANNWFGKPSLSSGPGTIRYVGFSDLAPEALALILRDCASMQNFATGLGVKKIGETQGRGFWISRNNGTMQHAWRAAFPPLTPYLGDDGKVYLSNSDAVTRRAKPEGPPDDRECSGMNKNKAPQP